MRLELKLEAAHPMIFSDLDGDSSLRVGVYFVL
jgi:hypothetical protein